MLHKTSLHLITFVGNIVGKPNITNIMNKLPNNVEINNLINSELKSMEIKLRSFANTIQINVQESKLIWEYGKKKNIRHG